MKYDLVVVGSGPSGQKGAIAAAKLNKRVAIIERNSSQIGGVCLHTGTIPSKTMREAILHLTGYQHRDVYAERYRRKRRITMEDLQRSVASVNHREMEVVEDQLTRNGVDIYAGEARFVDSHTVEVTRDGDSIKLETENVLLAVGTRPDRNPATPFDGQCVFDSDELLNIDHIPRSMIVVGGGVIGIEYAIMFATLGVNVTVVDGRDQLLGFCDKEIVDTLLYHARSIGMVFRLGENVVKINRLAEDRAAIELESGKRLVAESILMAVGRTGDTDTLNLEAAGLKPDARGRVECNEHHETAVSHIYGVGDVVGFPALASVSMEQGRRAIAHMYGEEERDYQTMPYGLFTIPEISMIGENEEELTARKVPYEVGVARFREIAKGQIVGDRMGLLKLLFHRDTRKVLGVHVIGDSATEIVHIGQAVMQFGGTIDYFRDTVFNYPTMAECYKVAAFDGLNKISLDLQLEQEISQQEADILEQVDELVAETQAATQHATDEAVVSAGDVN
jgi:NAD(P) transhydrogenase